MYKTEFSGLSYNKAIPYSEFHYGFTCMIDFVNKKNIVICGQVFNTPKSYGDCLYIYLMHEYYKPYNLV